MKCE
jgi:hypothetical protein